MTASDLRGQLQSALGATYTLERELGGGGMSRVFVAEEAALGRKVVVKVLPPELAAELSAERFAREIRVAASLQHPNIVPVLSTGVADGVPYYTMPFVRGESLRARLAHGALPPGEAISVLRDVARALAHAHAEGVVHRDVKPENVLLSGGAAVVTDFGIAKAVSASRTAAGATLTSAGTALGTPAYMAPEQALGDEVDARADLYAWGVMAYEMIAGAHPFADRTTAQQLVGAHLSETPRQLALRATDVSPALAALVMRCLAKAPAERPASARELLDTLYAIGTPGRGRPAAYRRATSSHRRMLALVVAALAAVGLGAWAWLARRSAPNVTTAHTLAVLPFENASRDTAYDYLAEGLSDELRSALTTTPGLSVKARGSSRRFRGGSADARTAGEQLGVEVVLVGSLARSADRVRIVAELVKAASGNALWSATYERPAKDVGPLQDSVALAVRRVLGVERANEPDRVLTGVAARGTADDEAYDAFLRGNRASETYDWPLAVTYYERAVRRDPRFARAYARMANARAVRPTAGLEPRDSAVVLATRDIETASRLDSVSVDLAVARAALLNLEFHFDSSARLVQSALGHKPNDPDLRRNNAWALMMFGRVQEALDASREAVRLDPLNGLTLLNYQYTKYIARDYPGAIDLGRRILELNSRDVPVMQIVAMSQMFTGHADSAVAMQERAIQHDSTLGGGRIYLVLAYAAANRWADAKSERARLEAEPAGNSPHFRRAMVEIAFHQFDAAAEAMALSLEQREPLVLANSVPCEPLFDPLKSKPRFLEATHRYWPELCPASGRWPIASPPPEVLPRGR